MLTDSSASFKDDSHRRVLSLANMCAATVGGNLQAEVVQGLAVLGGETDEAELYKSVLMLYRRCDARLSVIVLYEHKHLNSADGLFSNMRHPWSLTPAQIIHRSCSVFLVLCCPMAS